MTLSNFGNKNFAYYQFYNLFFYRMNLLMIEEQFYQISKQLFLMITT